MANPTKPVPDAKGPQTVDSGKKNPASARDADRPADTGGKDVSQGSQGDRRRASNGAR